ncbi:nitrate- and nitrite sensing domain-containing protein [Cellulomonas sp. C5510]|uniref:nitrate- and nitrite sensing domain-containing protein n=1 Tax=Cellulomonas sp. C5510 TaxID=2871170 RepID=UPI001C957BED|nr:nitrate- and nitrite sensing domain-containing protein [Cellulomonas sp. C5510]QZN85450.1 nitrate- and nitrite sensing domain-containing protein [Cellulomonas sp. C5510]
MLRRLGIRAKVLAVLAVPVLVLLLAAGYIAAQSVAEARTAATVRDIVATLPQYSRAAEALQQERTLSVQQASDSALGGNLTVSRSATDDAVAALGVALRSVDLSGLDARVADAVKNASNQHTRLIEIRDRVDAGSIPPSLVDSNYTDIVRADNQVPVTVAETLSERSLASRMSAFGAVADTIEQVLRAQPVAAEVIATDGADGAQVRELSSLFAVQDQARDDARSITNTLRLPGLQLASRDADLTAMQLALESGNPATIAEVDATRWNSLVNAELAVLRPVASQVLTAAGDRADTIASQAREQALITGGIAAVAAALSILIALVVSRGIVVPLRRLTVAAGQVREELPRLVEQVAVPGETPDLTLANLPVESRDEVGRLAQAFNDVNATTIEVAREQAALRGSIAEMFVNVARRDQVLLGRQLAFIDSLERSEEDPATLANLFRLDHLATRMRRNAESLLVLAGIDSGRRLREAMPLSDVVRTASSEIEQYDRVQLDLGADPLMHGFNALAAAHLLAELLENATLFSEPGTPVLVATAVEGDHVVVRIADQGLGMAPDELSAANTTIRSTSPTEALGAQRLGLYVVARLSQRLGARVRLERSRSTSSSGTLAVVEFPVALFTAHDPALAGGLAGPQRAAGPETGALPVAEPPVAVPVDLAALTDGATPTGLPRRRTPGASPDGAPAEQDVVLPAPAEATLAPEVAAEAGGWTPMVAPSGAPAALPSRGPALPTRGPAAGGTETPGAGEDRTVAERMPAAPRGGLFAGFRGRDALAAGGAPVTAGPGPDGLAPGTAAEPAEESSPQDVPAPGWPADVPGDDGAASAWPRADVPAVVDDPAVAAPAEPEPLVVPGLVPDDPALDSQVWAGTAFAPPDPSRWSDETQVLPPQDTPPATTPARGDVPGAAWDVEPAWRSGEPEAFLGSGAVPAAPEPSTPSVPDLVASDPFPPSPIAPDAFLPDGPATDGALPGAFLPDGPATDGAAPGAFLPDAPVAPPALPDFAELVRGDDPAPPAERPRRQRARRSFFSLRRRREAPPASPAAAAPATSAPVASPAEPAPAAPAVPAPAASPAAPARRSARGAHAAPEPPHSSPATPRGPRPVRPPPREAPPGCPPRGGTRSTRRPPTTRRPPVRSPSTRSSPRRRPPRTPTGTMRRCPPRSPRPGRCRCPARPPAPPTSPRRCPTSRPSRRSPTPTARSRGRSPLRPTTPDRSCGGRPVWSRRPPPSPSLCPPASAVRRGTSARGRRPGRRRARAVRRRRRPRSPAAPRVPGGRVAWTRRPPRCSPCEPTSRSRR